MKNRIGEKFVTKNGEVVEIILYRNCNDVDVKFEDGNIRYSIKYDNLKKGYIKNLKSKLGFIGEGKHKAKIDGKYTKAYRVWRSMLTRCYNNKWQIRFPAYKGCSVHEDWHNFQIFAEWFYKNYKESYELDKDILFKNNRVYSEETCVFVPRALNSLLLNSKGKRGKYFIGVSFNKEKSKFTASLNSKRIGLFDTEIEAFNFYKLGKEKHIRKVANEFKDLIDKKTYLALINFKIEITD
ncbi:hypothetical protein [Flavobacterium sp. GNP002]